MWFLAVSFLPALAAPSAPSPVRALTPAELAAATQRAGVTDVEAAQCFHVAFAPFTSGADVLVGEAGITVLGPTTTTHAWGVDGGLPYGGVRGVAFWDLDGNGFQDVVGVTNLCMGANCVENNWDQLLVLLNDGTTLAPARTWAASVPFPVVGKGLAAVRAYARAHVPVKDAEGGVKP